MIKQKAPKDMTAEEFVEYFKDKKQVPSYGCNIRDIYNDMVKMLSDPAPNPFTPDQLAWMRVEQAYRKINYAACEERGTIVFFEDKPIKNPNAIGRWASDLGYREVVGKDYTFLADVLSVDDPEPLCFADYAPLEEK